VSQPLRLVLLDIDGCLIAGEARPWNFRVMEFIAQLNRRAREDEDQFAVTLCTGRPEPYVEAIVQAIDGYLPAIYENGGGLYFPAGYRFAEHPALTPEMSEALAEIRHILRRELVQRGIAQFQPGKEVSLTLYPARADIGFAQLAEMARRALDGKLNGYSVHASLTTVEILPPGIDKGAGAEWLARETGIALSEMAGIGDAPSDLAYLRKCAVSATTANAPDLVKRAVHYVSPHTDSLGTQDILERWRVGPQ
jgi:HAD superfamily hydrolase (TIGR01484 family)